MTSNQHQTRSKITVRIWAPILEALITRTDAACLRRDALISRALEIELPRITSEIPHRNSEIGRRHIEAHLQTLLSTPPGAKQVSLGLDPQVASQLQAVCDEINAPRESLLNRLFMLLGAPGSFIADHFTQFTPESTKSADFEPVLTPEDLTEQTWPPTSLDSAANYASRIHDVRSLVLEMTARDAESSTFDLALSPLGRIDAVVGDPFGWYRMMLLVRYQELRDSFLSSGHPDTVAAMERERFNYTPFGMAFEDEHLHGLNCYMPDHWVAQSPLAAQLQPASLAASIKQGTRKAKTTQPRRAT